MITLEVLAVQALDDDIVVRETAKRALQSRKDFLARFEQSLPSIPFDLVNALAYEGSREVRAIIARSERTSLEPFLGEWDPLVLAEICLRVVRAERDHKLERLQALHAKSPSALDPSWSTLLDRIRKHPNQDLQAAERAACLVIQLSSPANLLPALPGVELTPEDFQIPQVKSILLQGGCLRASDLSMLSETETLEYAKNHYRTMVLKNIPLPCSSDFIAFLKDRVGSETDSLVLDALLGIDSDVDNLIALNPHTYKNSLLTRKMFVPDIDRVELPPPPTRAPRYTTVLKKPYPLVSGDVL